VLFRSATSPGRTDIGFTAATSTSSSSTQPRPCFAIPSENFLQISDYQVDDYEWHHYAWTYDHTAQVLRLYVDGELEDEWTGVAITIPQIESVLNESVYSIGGRYEYVFDPNEDEFVPEFEKNFTGFVNNLRTFGVALSEEHLRDVMLREQVHGSDFPEASSLSTVLTFDTISATTNYGPFSGPALFSQGIARGGHYTPNWEYLISAELPGGIEQAGFLYGEPDTYADIIFPSCIFETFDADNTPADVTIDQIFPSEWLRVTWLWKEEVLLQAESVILAASDSSAVSGLPFFTVGTGSITTYTGTDAAQGIWVEVGDNVIAGTLYRTADRAFTISDVSGTFAFSGLSSSGGTDLLEVGSLNGFATRQTTLTVNEHGKVTWTYERSPHRAYIAIGAALSVETTSGLNTSSNPDLIPILPDTASLDTTQLSNSLSIKTIYDPLPNSQFHPPALIWDQVGQQVLPVKPGVWEIEWPDETDLGEVHRIQIVAGFPGDTLSLPFPREDPDNPGELLTDGAATDYVTTYTFDDLSEAFPAAPSAHYHVVYDSAAQNLPRVFLDEDPNDPFRYALTPRFATTTNLTVNANSETLAATGPGKIALAWTYRPDLTTTATGDTTQEAFMVRIIEAENLEDVAMPDTAMGDGDYQMLAFDGTSAGEYEFGSDENNVFLLPPPLQTFSFTLAFWSKLDLGTDATPTLFTLALENRNADDNLIAPGQVYGSFEWSAALSPATLGDHYELSTTLNLFNATTSLGTTDFGLPLDLFAIGDEWHHYTFVYDEDTFSLYIDGILIASQTVSVPSFGVGTWWFDSLRLGQDTTGNLDNLQLWPEALSPDQIRLIMTSGYATSDYQSGIETDLSYRIGILPTLNLTFDDSGVYESLMTINVTNPATLADHDLDGPVEVASQIETKLDRAGFGTGLIINPQSNYNFNLYNAEADAGEWGPIFPVNSSLLFTGNRELEVLYYQNPYELLEDATHPNVAWPYHAITYNNVIYPTVGKDANKRIYIASRLGTEGVAEEDLDGNSQPDDQLVFDPALYQNLAIYHQPNPDLTGYNPNEEHALVAPSIKAILTGDATFDLGQEAAFALQNQLNQTDTSDVDTYTSEPWVLVQYQDARTDEWEMAAYKVEQIRDYTIAQENGFSSPQPFPILNANGEPATEADGTPTALPANPVYYFQYPFHAGDLVTAPYPLNTIIVQPMALATGGNLLRDTNGDFAIDSHDEHRRALWFDKHDNPWVVSGDSAFFFNFWYPFRRDFWFEDLALNGRDGSDDINAGTPFAFLSSNGDYLTSNASPVNVFHDTYWRTDYPVLKRGETVTYSGGEHFQENPTAEGLPAVVTMASAQVVYDSLKPDMFYQQTASGSSIEDLDLAQYGVQIVRPLDAVSTDISQSTLNTTIGLTPADSTAITPVGDRYYFPQLTGSLQKKLYYDTLTFELIYRGLLNDLESGDPDLASRPLGLYLLEPAFMTDGELEDLTDDSLYDAGTWATALTTSDWQDAIHALHESSRDPNGISYQPTIDGDSVELFEEMILGGFEAAGDDDGEVGYYTGFATSGTVTADPSIPGDPAFRPINALGTGLALVPNNRLLNADTDEDLYLTIAENNHPSATGAVALHVIQISPERFRGNVKLVEGKDVFSEKVNIAHTADFGGDTSDVYYQWFVRETALLDEVGLPADVLGSDEYDDGWIPFAQGLGLNLVSFEANPEQALSDKLFYVRYGDREDLDLLTQETTPRVTYTESSDTYSVDDEAWRLVSLDPADEESYAKTPSDQRIPFQWAGAAQSPALQSDGSLAYVPQLIAGWVKRVIDRINPYEARYSDFFDNESPATYSSMLQILGAPYSGDVALNSAKPVIEAVGLIELYTTVLNRAKNLAASANATDTATNQAILLASTRLATFFEILGREAFTDAQDPTINVADGHGALENAVPYVHAFYNMESNVIQETLSLLRGTDIRKSFPVFNRLFWNFTSGLGEAAYASTYQLYDTADNAGELDGFIDAEDAARLYPMGHGDAWGHYLSATKMIYGLLKQAGFEWEALPELYPLLDNVLEVDYLDEKTFSRIAAAKASTGAQIVHETYRASYVHNPDGQWQGYADSDSTRAWGVSGWAARAGQGALFDWAVANAIVPRDASDGDPENTDVLEQNLALIDRQVNRKELSQIAAAFQQIQSALDNANYGMNPIGLDADALVMNFDPLLASGSDSERRTFFQQTYDKAVVASLNALAALRVAADASAKINRDVHNTIHIQQEAFKQDIHYRNRLIEIFGTPYSGTIGAGKFYPEGYDGPDTALYLYIDEVEWEKFVPSDSKNYSTRIEQVFDWPSNFSDFDFQRAAYNAPNVSLGDIFDGAYLSSGNDFRLDAFTGNSVVIPNEEISYVSTVDYGLQAPDGWGKRDSYGEIQILLNEMLAKELSLAVAEEAYIGFSKKLMAHANEIENELKGMLALQKSAAANLDAIEATEAFIFVFSALRNFFNDTKRSAEAESISVATAFPLVLGFSNDATSGARSATRSVGASLATSFAFSASNFKETERTFETVAKMFERELKVHETYLKNYQSVNSKIASLARDFIAHTRTRKEIAHRYQEMEIVERKLISAIDEGFRLLEEREAFNITLASDANRNRYRDMLNRLTRNEAMAFYNSAFRNAQRYTWLAAKAYDYETSLDPDSPYNAEDILTGIVRASNLGYFDGDSPQVSQGGLAEILSQLNTNYSALQGQLGLNNPQYEQNHISLRHELFRIKTGTSTSDDRWRNTLNARRVDNLFDDPSFLRYCRPFADPSDGAQPGIIIEFNTQIEPGTNLFGWPLGPGDHAFSSSNFATKINRIGLRFVGYNEASLASTPRAYLVPVGQDWLQTSDGSTSSGLEYRQWNVLEQVIPPPHAINAAQLGDSSYIPSIDGADGIARILRRADFPAETEAVTFGLTNTDQKLVGRSVWNTRWLLVIPGIGLHGDADYGLDEFVDQVTDIELFLETYSHNGL